MPSEKSSAKAIFLSSRAFSEKVERYFAEYLPEGKEIADVESLCCYLGVSRRRLFELAKEKRYADIVENALCRIAAQKKQLAFRGGIPATVFSFDFKNNHGYSDKPEQTASDTTIVLEGKAKEWSE